MAGPFAAACRNVWTSFKELQSRIGSDHIRINYPICYWSIMFGCWALVRLPTNSTVARQQTRGILPALAGWVRFKVMERKCVRLRPLSLYHSAVGLNYTKVNWNIISLCNVVLRATTAAQWTENCWGQIATQALLSSGVFVFWQTLDRPGY